MKAKPDWKKIKLEYLKGKSREEICEEFGVSYNSLNKQISKNKWAQNRDKIGIKTEEKLEEKLSEILAEKQKQALLQQESDFKKLIEISSKDLEYKDLESLNIISGILDKAYKNLRQSLGINEKYEIGGKVEHSIDPDILAVAKILNERKQNRE